MCGCRGGNRSAGVAAGRHLALQRARLEGVARKLAAAPTPATRAPVVARAAPVVRAPVVRAPVVRAPVVRAPVAVAVPVFKGPVIKAPFASALPARAVHTLAQPAARIVAVPRRVTAIVRANRM
jgi:hypothetical protein